MTLSARLAALAIVCGAVPTAAIAQDARGEAALARGRTLYYSLAKHGFAGGQCQVRPDWEGVLAELPRNAQKASAYAILDQLRMTLAVSDGGAATVDGVDPGAAQHPQGASGVSQIFQGANQALGGFFETWSGFMVNSPLPDAATSTAVSSTAGGYLLRYKDGESDVETTLRPNGEISKLVVKAATFDSTVQPHFASASDGLVLTDFQADYIPTEGKGVVHLMVHVDYQTTNGLQFPALITVDATVDGQRTNLRFHLQGCKLSRKAP
jgi:hypothetical protein